jgi:hypothetical protein
MLQWIINNPMAVIAVMGGAFALFKWNSAQKFRRAEQIEMILRQIIINETMLKILYMFEKNDIWYKDDFHRSENESRVDQLLVYMDYICYLRKTRNLTKGEFKILQYLVEATCRSNDVEKYLRYLYQKFNAKPPFPFLIQFGKKNGFFKDGFSKKDGFFYKKGLKISSMEICGNG